MRKPRPFVSNPYEFTGIAFDNLVDINMTGLSAKDCKRLAAWLLKAAEWIREKEAER